MYKYIFVAVMTSIGCATYDSSLVTTGGSGGEVSCSTGGAGGHGESTVDAGPVLTCVDDAGQVVDCDVTAPATTCWPCSDPAAGKCCDGGQ